MLKSRGLGWFILANGTEGVLGGKPLVNVPPSPQPSRPTTLSFPVLLPPYHKHPLTLPPARREALLGLCFELTQYVHRSVHLRTSVLFQPASNIRPLSQAKYVDLIPSFSRSNLTHPKERLKWSPRAAEGFLGLLGETYPRNQSEMRGAMDDQLEELSGRNKRRY